MVELEALRPARGEERDAVVVGRVPGEVGCELVREDHREEPVLAGQRERLAQRTRDQLVLCDSLDPWRCGTRPEGHRTRHTGRDDVEERERQVHDLGRYAVRVAKLCDLGRLAPVEVREHPVPPVVDDRAGRLGDVAEDGQ